VREEVKYLKENNLMDYSILLGIEQVRVNTYHDIYNANQPMSAGISS